MGAAGLRRSGRPCGCAHSISSAKIFSFSIRIGGLDGVQPAVHADAHVQIFGVVVEGPAVQVARPPPCRARGSGSIRSAQRVVLGQHRPAVAVAAQRLGREEAGGGDVGPVQRMLAVERAAEALGAESEISFRPCLSQIGLHGRIVGRLAEQIDGDDHARASAGPRPSPPRWRASSCGRVDIVGVRQHVDEHRRGADPGHDLGGGGEGEGRAEHRVAARRCPRPSAAGPGRRCRWRRTGRAGLAEGGQVGFELADLRAHDLGAADARPRGRRPRSAGQTQALGLKVDEGNHEGRSPRGLGAAAQIEMGRECRVVLARSRAGAKSRGVTSRCPLLPLHALGARRVAP